MRRSLHRAKQLWPLILVGLVSKVVENIKLLVLQAVLLRVDLWLIELLPLNIIIFAQILERFWLVLAHLLLLSLDLDRGHNAGALRINILEVKRLRLILVGKPRIMVLRGS
jgi:hypothetical protein